METGRAVAIVLAAGESRRMGTLKPLLPYGSGSVIQSVVRSLRASPVERVIVVLGHRSEEIAAHLESSSAEVLVNPRYPEGMLTSVQAGVQAAGGAEWLVIALGDQPSLRPAVVERLLAGAVSGSAGIVVPSYSGRRGHPLLIHGRYREEIGGLDPAVGLRELLLRHPDEIHYVEVGTDDVLRDMDTPEDYQREIERLGGG